MIKLQNNFKKLRHHLQIDDRKQFAELIKAKNYNQYTRWESHAVEPDILSYWLAYKELKKVIPELRFEDLFDEV